MSATAAALHLMNFEHMLDLLLTSSQKPKHMVIEARTAIVSTQRSVTGRA